MSRRLIIMQGHSGSGKTTFIKEIGKLGYNEGIAISTDDYFFDADGEYRFDENKLEEYHMKTLTKCIDHMQNAKKKNIDNCTIWLDNTNCKKEDIAPYLPFARFNKFQIIYIRVEGNFKHGFSKAPTTIIDQQKEDLKGFSYE